MFHLDILGVLRQTEDDQIFNLDIVGSFRLSEDRSKLYHFFVLKNMKKILIIIQIKLIL